VNRRHLLTAGVGAAAAVAGAGWAGWRLRGTSALGQPEQVFWNSQFERPGGGMLAMHTLRGKPLLLNFWATWCPPCVKEMPMLDAFYREQAAKGWQVLGLAVDNPMPVREFLAKLPVSFPVGLAGLGGVELSRRLGNALGGMPFTVVFDRSGTTSLHKTGALTPNDLSDWVHRLG